MSEKQVLKTNIVSLIRQSVGTIFTHPIILLPFLTIAFIQVFILEVLYFAPRWPLSGFFGPIIERLGGEVYLHYPFNLVILPKMFQIAQIPIYLFVSSFFIAVAVHIIQCINSGEKIQFRTSVRAALGQYVHIILTATISFGAFYGLFRLYGLLMVRATAITSTAGKFYALKMVILKGAPYFNLFIGVLITTLFAYMYPIIMIEKKKIFGALKDNFVKIGRSLFFIFFLILVPTLLYLPILLIRNNINAFADVTVPGVRMVVLLLSIVVMLAIDAVVYTSVTTHYLMKKENK